ncbi:histidine phosphatase family protein [Puniceibacterium sp. IMCC21224]|uniref:SixA phosphatase family protein n=1 Tax=Puniceibacterium sp. IMCC21224 TaxID=1618204 RepID=UPI00065D5F19|nr:histidine phosphatase family protein [Puniceibacterium sp. IMCC21224]KMK68226.1 phosphohistidine phosphatase SixA [Puniceibacterium sp. IMCC21224]
MRLVLMRHAKSDWSLNGEDHDRPLNKRGTGNARRLGDWLRTKSYLPDEVLCSTSIRTRQTLTLTGLDAATVRFEQALYHASRETMMELLQSASGNCVLMIGHNPGIAAFATSLVAVQPLHLRFRDYPTCATLVVDFNIRSWEELTPQSGNARDFVIPRELVTP